MTDKDSLKRVVRIGCVFAIFIGGSTGMVVQKEKQPQKPTPMETLIKALRSTEDRQHS